MAAKKIMVISTLMFSILMGGCKKFSKHGHMKDAGIMLSFDDDYVDNWYNYLPLLDSAGVKATFYVTKYKKFSPEQKHKLSILQSHGHEIAFHTTSHCNLPDYVYKQKHTVEEMYKYEIEDGLKLMNKDGFYPTTFAYPYGAHNGLFDKGLLRYFKSVRALNGTQDFSKSICATEKNNLLFSLGIDKSSKRKDADLINMLQSAKDNSACAMFVAHQINTDYKFSVTKERLLKLFEFVKNNNLKYYTASDISN